jgi:hypothetical protein
MYIVRFAAMRSMFRASRWADVSTWASLFSYHASSRLTGSTQDQNSDMVERLGDVGDAGGLDSMVPALQS